MRDAADNTTDTTDVGLSQKRFRTAFWVSISMIAAVAVCVVLMAVLFPSNIPEMSQTIKDAGVYLALFRWSLYAAIVYKFTAICRYFSPGARDEKIVYAKKKVLVLMLLYEVMVGLRAPEYFFDFFVNSTAGI